MSLGKGGDDGGHVPVMGTKERALGEIPKPFLISSFDLTIGLGTVRVVGMSYMETIQAERMAADEGFTPLAWHNIYIFTCVEGDAVVRVEETTNDNNDDGYPDGEITRWGWNARSVEDALRHAGKCRVGISGVIVTVLLDGKEVR